ncbi:hypothetical protein CCACVL1_03303, partial [Corchorus capsularis]
AFRGPLVLFGSSSISQTTKAFFQLFTAFI